jgi:hypothetical protein
MEMSPNKWSHEEVAQRDSETEADEQQECPVRMLARAGGKEKPPHGSQENEFEESVLQNPGRKV